mgnify:CR=1 FL=1
MSEENGSITDNAAQELPAEIVDTSKQYVKAQGVFTKYFHFYTSVYIYA